MTTYGFSFGGLAGEVPPRWLDTTDDVAGEVKPFTLAREDGVGALQFSTAIYHQGPLPGAKSSELVEMLGEFAQTHALGKALVQNVADGEMAMAAASFHAGEDFIRIWYLSDGKSFALVTYVCEWGKQESELEECEAIVQSLRFEGEPAELIDDPG